MQHISKRFFGTTVLDDVSLDCLPGEVHAIVGENGAGKSTLMKIIGGEYQPDEGIVLLDGQPVRLQQPSQAFALGISMIHQEFTLLPYRTVAENVLLGREPRRGRWSRAVDRRSLEATSAGLLGELGLTAISPRDQVRHLTVAQQQGVEIAKALSRSPRILVMDEPTAALTPGEVAALFARIRILVARGLTVLYISHRLTEIFDIANRVTVVKDGKRVDTLDVADTSAADLVPLMVGRAGLAALAVRHADSATIGTVRLSVRDGAAPGLYDIDLDVRAGEIVGLAGLDGSGRTELARALAGAAPLRSGTVEIDGQPRRLRSPRAAIRAGIASLTADRKAEGLVLPLSAADNSLLTVRAFGRARGSASRVRLAALAEQVGLSTDALQRSVQVLSGGNQQKVVITKWLATGAGVYVFDEPTRGIDVGAKAAIHQLMRGLADRGAAILMISSDLPEIIGVSDRIVVMCEGGIAGELPADATEESIMKLATTSRVPA
jgi:ribose transport system ATP-binding protein